MQYPTPEQIQQAMDADFTRRCSERIERDRIFSELRHASETNLEFEPPPTQLTEAILKLHERILALEGEVEY